jgi:hypothetical protein
MIEDPSYIPGVTPVQYPEPGATGTWTQDALPGTGPADTMAALREHVRDLGSRLQPGLVILRQAGIVPPEDGLTAGDVLDRACDWLRQPHPDLSAAEYGDLSEILYTPVLPVEDPDPELVALARVVAEDYAGARTVVEAMSRRDRAVLGFYLTELGHVLDAVDAADHR